MASLNNLLGLEANATLPIDLDNCDIDFELKTYENYLEIALNNNKTLSILQNKKLIENISAIIQTPNKENKYLTQATGGIGVQQQQQQQQMNIQENGMLNYKMIIGDDDDDGDDFFNS
jgi:hypothetical protein